MKITSYTFPKSSFLSMDKDINTIVDKFLNNQNLLKLLYYTNDTPLEEADIDEETAIGMVGGDGKQIKVLPKIKVDTSVLNYVIIVFNDFTPNDNNPHFRDNIITFNVICHYDQWQMSGEYAALRPYRIAGEIDSMFNDAKLSGIGTLHFMGARYNQLGDEFAGVVLMYQAIHGDDDTNPSAKLPDGTAYNSPMEDLIIDNYNSMFNEE